MRKTVKAIKKHPDQAVTWIYILSCGHVINADLRLKRHGARVQPKTAVCGECPASCVKPAIAEGV